MAEMVYRIPTDEEMAAIQREARRMRAEAMRHSLIAAFRFFRDLPSRFAARPATNEAR